MLHRPLRARVRDFLLHKEGALTKYLRANVRSRMAKMGWHQRKTGMAPPHGPEWEYVKLNQQLDPENVLAREGDETWKRDLQEAKMDPEYRKAIRKFRKLKRKAEKQGLDLDTLLLRRRSDRIWQTWTDAVEDGQAMKMWHHHVSYAVRPVEAFKERIEEEKWVYSKEKFVKVGRTQRTIRVEVIGYHDIHYSNTALHPPHWWSTKPVFTVGETFTRPLSTLRHPWPPRAKIRPLAECIQKRADYCRDRQQKYQHKVETVPREKWFTDYERDVVTWGEGYDRWMRFKEEFEGPDYVP